MHIVFQFYEYFYLILHDVYDILLEFVDIYLFVFSMQEFQKLHFVEEFEHIQLYKLNINKDLKKKDKPNSFRKLTQ
jgi:hypothetical protein